MKVWRKIHHGGKRADGARTAGKKEEEMLDFSVNVTPLGIPENIQEGMKRGLLKAGWYPDSSKARLQKAIGDFHNVEPEQICVGNGAADVIYRLVFAIQPRKVLVPAPTFGEYEGALTCVNAHVDYYRMSTDDFLIREDVCHLIEADTDMVFLCHPNNPTGRLVPEPVLKAVLNRCRETGTWLVVDECFLDFVSKDKAFSMIEFLGDWNKLIIIRSFTKMFGIPGIRLGYLICSKGEIADEIDRYGGGWNVNCIAEEAGIESLKSEEYTKKVVDYMTDERSKIRQKMLHMGYRVIEGEANFLLFQDVCPDPGRLGEWLLKQGIMIRCCDDYIHLDGTYYRIGIQTREMNAFLMKKLEEWIDLYKRKDKEKKL